MKDTDILHLYQYEKPKVVTLSSTASFQQSKKEIIKKVQIYHSLYSNWLALHIYNHYIDVFSDESKIDDNLVVNFQQLLSNCDIDKNAGLISYEKTYTALLSKCHDHYLFDGNIAACCLHQVTIADTTGKSPDVYVAKVNDSGMPVCAVLLADYKKDEYDNAYYQGIRYTIKVLSGEFCSLLSLPCSSKKVSLQLYIALNNEVGIIKICEADVVNKEDLKMSSLFPSSWCT